jgi:hypothetical protein
MPMWYGHWGGPWVGFGWIFPLVGLVVMVLMLLLCMRRMGGTMSGCEGHHGQRAPSEVEVLRREIQALRDELRTLRERT